MRATSGVVWECPVHNLGPTVNWFAALWAFAGLSYLYCQALCICAPLPPILRSALPAPYRREPVKSPLSADVGTPRFQPTTAACSVERAPEISPYRLCRQIRTAVVQGRSRLLGTART